MKNKKNQIKNHNLDSSYDSFKYSLEKNNKTKINNKFKYTYQKKDNEIDNYKNMYRNKLNLNKSKYTNEDKNNHVNRYSNNYLRINRNKTNDNISKGNIFKSKNIPLNRICNTPDRNIRYNLDLTPNKNNISSLKLKGQNYKNDFDYHHIKKREKLFFDREKSNKNYLPNKRKKALTPDKLKINNYGNIKKFGGNESNNYMNLKQRHFKNNFSKSFYDSNNNNIKKISDKYKPFNDSSSNYYRIRQKIRNKTPDRFDRNSRYSKLNNKISKENKFPILNNISQIKFSKSFCSINDRNGKNNYDLERSKGKKYKLSNSQINSNNKYLNQKNQSKILLRTKSSNLHCIRRNYFYSDDNSGKSIKYKNSKNNYNNTSSFEFSNKSRQNNCNLSIKQPFNNINTYQKKNDNIFSTNYENYFKKNEMTFSQKKANKDLGKYDQPLFNNINSSSFFEMAQQKINKVQSNKKYNNKFIGINNFVTKSSTNTYDEFNSSTSNISRKNTNLDSIEEIHFNFVNVVQSSKNLMKMENKFGDKVINNNPNSSVIFVEERDIE